uniref:Laminin subunit gamma 3 n=1 Tax=Calidris pygmaea TaxID=425635 RepID=A0A8C3KAX5_9CHAR
MPSGGGSESSQASPGMARPPGLCLLAFLGLGLGTGVSPSCWDPRGQPRRCMPDFENAAFGRAAEATNTCGSPPEDYCLQMGARHASALCHRCDATDPRLHHNASFLTDFHSQEESTWWQSQSMAFGIQYPNSVNITLHLGKAYEITYVRLKFHTSRPESFAIYKRSRAEGPWVPFQFYSASCEKTYGKRQRHYLRPGEDEQVAFCTDEFSDISPLSGGNVAFSTLEGRPSAYNFDGSPALQEWVTVTDLLISLNRLNTFGDDIFKDPKVLQSYYYAISDFSVGGRCKCNGHASECAPDDAGQLVCVCQHHTAGADCERCQPFYQDRPWARGTAEAANECLPCNCSGRSEECFYDRELYRRSGHGGHCRNCRDNTAGPHCERCRQNHYRWEERAACQPCHCHPAGSLQPQCDSSGTCLCKANVTGWKCERCKDGYHSLSEGGCRPCACDPAGSVGICDPNTGHCTCKERVEGHLCNRCQPGWFNLQPHNPAGCTSCFCYGHSTACTAADGYEVTHVHSDFSQGTAPPTAARLARSFLPPSFSNRLHEAEEGAEPLLSAFSFQRLLSNLTALRLRVSRLSLSEVQLTSARPGPGARAGWVEECTCPPGYTGQFCQSCAPGFKREIPFGSPFGSCVPCTCNQHGDCHPLTGQCRCLHNTEGPSCERCSPGFYGNPFVGRFDDCKPCPCPGHSPCTEMPGSGEVVCTHCPPGQRGKRCELCDDGFFGDPLGQRGPVHPCVPCQCHGNVDLNAVGNCDPVSGRCLRCLYNTTGEHCEKCQPGFYGDALAPDPPGKCAPCDCHPDGSVPGQEGCDPSTGQCRCLPHVTGRACGLCQPGYYGLQPAVGCKSCQCHPMGSRESECHALTGQCSCQPGVTGKQCDRCHHGFFGFSARGCRACNCSPLGSVTPQCHENSTCLCRPGFVGYKCDRCQANFFLDPPSSRCQQCPACYGLVKDEVQPPCSPTRSPSWTAWKVKGTGQSISGHSSALTTLALGAKGRKGQLGDIRIVPTGMRKVLGHRKGQAALRRRMALVRDRAMAEAQRKIKQAERTLGNSLSISTTARRTAGEAEQVSGESAKVREERCGVWGARAGLWGAGGLVAITVCRAQVAAGDLEQSMQAEAVLSAGRLQLERLWLRLATPGALAGQLSLLQQEAARQQEKIQAFESDLAEIRADKQNLEDILRSLPEGCSK